MLALRVRTPLRPTEDPERVRRAVLALFPDATLREEGGWVLAEPASLERLREMVRQERIPDTARGQMLAGLSRDGLRAKFRLGKQAAAAGHAHFDAVGGPLGAIEVEIAGTDVGEVERAIYRVAPDTTVPAELSEVPMGERPLQ